MRPPQVNKRHTPGSLRGAALTWRRGATRGPRAQKSCCHQDPGPPSGLHRASIGPPSGLHQASIRPTRLFLRVGRSSSA
ncbi:hypothetical protein EYF80_024597 [Liparis tanakae]|uniref:Uncharacterized protein n=1 Tax=Liparis tanakae TaxID=230148 RepID=A0A4Z2HI39_9TELE|nr:hypothetical protein EYF80_024597 [Liparis tanakae]